MAHLLIKAKSFFGGLLVIGSDTNCRLNTDHAHCHPYQAWPQARCIKRIAAVCLLLGLVAVLSPFANVQYVYAAAPPIDVPGGMFGTGQDGDLIVSEPGTIVNTYATALGVVGGTALPSQISMELALRRDSLS